MAKRTQHVGKSTGKSKTKMRMYTTREARKVAEKNGWVLVRSNGDHWYYKKSGVPKMLTISEKLNRMVWERCVKEYELDLNV